jgi:hypothetical protein
VQRGIVASISARSVGRFLKRGRSPAASQPLLAARPDGGSRRVRGASGAGL